MLKKINNILGKADIVLRYYPMVLVTALLAVVSAICYVELEKYIHRSSFFYLKFTIVSMLGISVFFAVKMLAQRWRNEILYQVIGLILLLIVYFQLPSKESAFTEVYAYFLIPVFLLSHLAVSFLAFLNRSGDLNFWQFNKNLFINIFLTFVFTAVLTGGVLLAILAVDNLFDFNFTDRFYIYPSYFFLIFGSCFIFLLFNENGLPKLEMDGDYPSVLKFFTQFILIPLLLIYVVILFFYAGKILVNWELPRGWVSYLILAYSMVGILALLLVHPLKEIATRTWVKIFSTVFYYSLLPLLILLFVAIFTRLLAYGFTEPRYFVLILAMWLTTVTFYFIFVRNASIKYIPISLFVFGLISLTFPYLNAFAVSKRSQKKELKILLSENHLLINEKIDFSKKIKSDLVYEIADKFDYLAKRYESTFLESLVDHQLAKTMKRINNDNRFYSNRTLLENSFINIIYEENSGNLADWANEITLISKSQQLDINEYDYLLIASNFKNNSFTIDNNTLTVPLENNQRDGFRMFFNRQEINVRTDLDQLFTGKAIGKTHNLDELSIVKKVDRYTIKIIFDELTTNKIKHEKSPYLRSSTSVIILVKKQ